MAFNEGALARTVSHLLVLSKNDRKLDKHQPKKCFFFQTCFYLLVPFKLMVSIESDLNTNFLSRKCDVTIIQKIKVGSILEDPRPSFLFKNIFLFGLKLKNLCISHGVLGSKGIGKKTIGQRFRFLWFTMFSTIFGAPFLRIRLSNEQKPGVFGLYRRS